MTDDDAPTRTGLKIAILGGYDPARTARLIRRLERVAEIQAERMRRFGEIAACALTISRLPPAESYLPPKVTARTGKGNGGGRRRGQRKGSNPWE